MQFKRRSSAKKTAVLSTPIGCGIDVVELVRFRQAMVRGGRQFMRRVFTNKEEAYSKARKHTVLLHLAGRFAAKEAIFKALGDDTIGWKDLAILNDSRGKPYCKYHKKSFHGNILLTISHSKNYAVANAIVTA